MNVYALTYCELIDGENVDKVELFTNDDFSTFISKAIFYQSRPFEYNDLKIHKGELKEIELKKYKKDNNDSK